MSITKSLSGDKIRVLMSHANLPDNSEKWSSLEVTPREDTRNTIAKECWA
jgi:hypothetical protein